MKMNRKNWFKWFFAIVLLGKLLLAGPFANRNEPAMQRHVAQDIAKDIRQRKQQTSDESQTIKAFFLDAE